MIHATTIRVTTVGTNGVATGAGYSLAPLNGELISLAIDWSASAPGSSDIAITVEADAEIPALTLYGKSDSVADAVVYPRVQATSTAGEAIEGQYVPLPVTGRIKVAVTGCNALSNAAVVTAYVRD